MIEFLRFTLVLTGLVYMVTEATVTAPLRMAVVEAAKRAGPTAVTWSLSIYCQSCTGFWLGAALGAVEPPLPALVYAPLEAALAAVAILWVLTPHVARSAYDREQAQTIADYARALEWEPEEKTPATSDTPPSLRVVTDRGPACPDDGEHA